MNDTKDWVRLIAGIMVSVLMFTYLPVLIATVLFA